MGEVFCAVAGRAATPIVALAAAKAKVRATWRKVAKGWGVQRGMVFIQGLKNRDFTGQEKSRQILRCSGF